MPYTLQDLKRFTKAELIGLLLPIPAPCRPTAYLMLDEEGETPVFVMANSAEEAAQNVIDNGDADELWDAGYLQEDAEFTIYQETTVSLQRRPGWKVYTRT